MWKESFVILLRHFLGVSMDGLWKTTKNLVSLPEIRTEHLSNTSLDPYRNANLLYSFFPPQRRAVAWIRNFRFTLSSSLLIKLHFWYVVKTKRYEQPNRLQSCVCVCVCVHVRTLESDCWRSWLSPTEGGGPCKWGPSYWRRQIFLLWNRHLWRAARTEDQITVVTNSRQKWHKPSHLNLPHFKVLS
jgi:hypothetical protein